jgi:hypothetical protein
MRASRGRAGGWRGLGGYAAVAGIAWAAALPADPASAATAIALLDLSLTAVSTEASQVGVNSVQSVIRDIRDSIQAHRRGAGGPNRPLAYAWDPDAIDPDLLAYTTKAPARNPLATVPAAPTIAPVQYAVWGQVYGDRERRRGTFLDADISRSTTAFGGLAGVDATISGLASPSDALVVGLLAGEMESVVRNDDGSGAHVKGPSVGLYVVYVYGGLSFDTSMKADFLRLDRSSPGIDNLDLGMTNVSLSANLNNKYDFESWWIEPTAGISATRSFWDEASKQLGFDDGTNVRLQGGMRFGTSVTAGGIQIDPSLTALVYDDVIITGGGIAVVTAAGVSGPTDQGKLFGQLVAKLNFNVTNNFSSYVETEVRGRDGVLGSAARVGVRYSFQ